MPPPNAHALPTALVSLPRLHRSMYEAAWWVVTARSARIVEADALTHDWRLVFLHTLAPMTLLWHPTTQTVQDSPFSVDPEVDVLTQSWTEGYLHQLYSGGPAAAVAYARIIEGWRTDARNKLMSLARAASAHDMQLARDAEAVRKTLVLTMFAAEIAMVVVGLMIAFPAVASAATGAMGLGPVVTGGSSAAEAGWGAAAVSSLYNQAADLVRDPTQAHAVAIDADQPMVRQAGMRAFEKPFEKNVLTHQNSFKAAVKTVRTLNARIAATHNPVTRVVASAQRIPAGFNVGAAKTAWEGARRLENSAKDKTCCAQVVFAADDVITAWKKFQENWKA